TGKVEIDISSTAQCFEARIADNGPGVPSAIRTTLFDPFVSSGKPNGTGLGLAIASKIVQDHSGSISVEQSTPEGTTIFIKLPRYAPQ
ncbi:MAG TPA: HAMP domain-containing sensor histidine kinase, partial [Candidatus Eremiobacteraceae bacterium]|nr:HAMP domain-containing sensor histidine kinase [Candidatus Eremiobacteraceae bacterium]